MCYLKKVDEDFLTLIIVDELIEKKMYAIEETVLCLNYI